MIFNTRLTPAVKGLLFLFVGSFLLQQSADQFFGGSGMQWFSLYPPLFFKKQYYWQLITFSFLHFDVPHLLFNLMTLVFIGSEIESIWGSFRFLRYFFICSFFSGAIYLLLYQCFPWARITFSTPMLGTSAFLYGLLIVHGFLFGERMLFFMMLFPMKSKHFIVVLAGLEMMTAVYSGGNVGSSFANLSGMVVGVLYISFIKRKSSKRVALVRDRFSQSIVSESMTHFKEEPRIWH